MNWLEEVIFKWRWLDNKVTKWRLWYFRAFKMRGMRVAPKGWVDQLIAEQELRKKQEEGWQAERNNREVGTPQASGQEVRERRVEDVIPKDWLRDQLTLDQAEADNTPAGGRVPFGGQNDKWERLKPSLQRGDQIWSFCSSPESWEHLAGRAGVAIVRDGRVVDCVITMMN